MGIREIPTSYEYTCDACAFKHIQENAHGHYGDSRPPHWTRLKIARTAYDYQGNAVADSSFEKLLCPKCSEVVFKAANEAIGAQGA